MVLSCTRVHGFAPSPRRDLEFSFGAHCWGWWGVGWIRSDLGFSVPFICFVYRGTWFRILYRAHCGSWWGGGWIRSHVFPYVVSMSDLRFSVPFICFEYRKGYMVSPPPPVGFWNLVSGPIVGVGGGEAGFWPMFFLMLRLHQN